MDRFDKVFCWTLTAIIVGAGCYFFASAPKLWPDGLLICFFSVAGLSIIWRHVAGASAKLTAEYKLDAARRRFDSAAVAFMRALDNGVAGSPSRFTAEGRELLAAWSDYHQELDGTAELVRRLRR